MKGNNLAFLTDPEGYLRHNAIECYNVGSAKLTEALTRCGVGPKAQGTAQTLELDLVPQKGFVSLQILGMQGTYAKAKRRGRPLLGAWLSYLGQTSVPNPDKMGCVCADDVGADMIFTVGLTGCTVVAVKDRGKLFFYHEPTALSWGKTQPDYPGTVVERAAPDYRAEGAGGFAVIVRRGSGWRVIVQTCIGVAVRGVETYDVS